MKMVNTFRAHQLVDWAGENGKAHEANMALFHTFFTRRENLYDTEVLAEVAMEIGLDAIAVRTIIDSPERIETVRKNEQFRMSRGVAVVPAMIFERQHLVSGAQGEDNYARILQHLVEEKAA